MPQCNALLQYKNGQRCQREAVPGRSKCRMHGGNRLATIGDTRDSRLAHKACAREMFVLAQLAGISYIGRIPNGGIEELTTLLEKIAKRK